MKLNASAVLKPALTLFVICLVVTALLAGTNMLTKDRIAEQAQITAEESRRIVLSEADTFEETDGCYTGTRGGEVVELPSKEFQLLFLLLSYPNKILTKESILDSVWGYASESDENTVRTHINRLRNKFENYPEFDIVTVRGIGYKAVLKK